ncbi:LysR family transcriptional regulator [Sphingomonas ginkgonis]|uniref:LysR family transcriptional regulator n=1 Tax=Sphingomonas ginkgonis TaxID=2315330 RepID=A0A3R9YM77_9SPHN|nr:LysR substrate-binding domain-containing protein [Sphingomonas ginkgonis]RST30923.1 LysR family transcriptional regulator [Sphingomonas ginkgonis]
MRRLPPLGSIQAFVHVARLGSVKAAADALALSSPALTRRIQSLEQYLGLPLFDRQHNSIRLNGNGDRFLVEVAPHVDALADAVDRVGSGGGSTSMRLKVAMPSLFAAQRLMPAVNDLRRSHPTLSLDLDTGPNRLGRLREGLDAAIVIAERIDDQYYSRHITGGQIVPLGSRQLLEGPDAVRSPADIRRLPILLHRDLPGAFRIWKEAIGMPDLEPLSTSSFDAGQLILEAAAGGMGIAYMLDGHLASSTDQRLVQVFAQTAPSPYRYWFVCLPGALNRRPVRLFHDWLFERFAVAPAHAA